MDGQVSTVYPNDFCVPDTNSSINITTQPWTYLPSTTAIQTKNYLVGYYKAGNNPPWVDPWNQFAPGL